MTSSTDPAGFRPPPYPYDRLVPLRAIAAQHDGGCVDLSIGTPSDPPPAAVVAALGASNLERSYPLSVGSEAFRRAACEWMQRRLDVAVDPQDVGACVGTKEFVAGLPHWLRLRSPQRDTVLYPAVSYPSYEMGAILAGARAVPVAMDAEWRIDLDSIDDADAARALCLWVNTPGNPAGGLDDLAAVAAWGRDHGVPVFSDECYVEFTWNGPRHTILEHGHDGVVAVHSLSKRSNLAGVRAGVFAGDRELVHYLREVRKHAGFMVPGPVQAAAEVAWADDQHVEEQRARYHGRLVRLREILAQLDIACALPGGGFYLWPEAPGGDAWALARRLAEDIGVLGSPGEFYGAAGAGHLRLAVVAPDAAIELAARRVAAR